MTAKEMVAAMDVVDNTHPATMEMARQARRNVRLTLAADRIEAAYRRARSVPSFCPADLLAALGNLADVVGQVMDHG